MVEEIINIIGRLKILPLRLVMNWVMLSVEVMELLTLLPLVPKIQMITELRL